MGSYTPFFNTRTRYLLGFMAMLFIAIICVAFNASDSDNFDLARQEILLRKVGHEILLHSGDSTSRVMPVQKIAENEYQLRFENDLTFQTDSLVTIMGREMSKNNLAHNYIVNVLNCDSKAVVYGYAIANNKHDDIIACSGRKQPKSCYLIDIKFQNNGISAVQKGCFLGGIPLLAFIGIMVSRGVTMRKDKTLHNAETLKIGQTLFDPKKRSLTCDQIVAELTAKENKLLLIFARSPNIIIERGRLQKEIWEDEGVIVGRSLDVFISKLRKKLELDASIQLVNIHGKGYKLEIS